MVGTTAESSAVPKDQYLAAQTVETTEHWRAALKVSW